MSTLFALIIADPLYNILIAAYTLIPPHDFGIAIIATTILIKIGTIHLSRKQIEGQKKMQEIQPEIRELQKRYKDNKEQQTKELLALYKKHNTTPVSGCLPLIVQIVIFFAFYSILFKMNGASITVDSSRLYTFIANPGTITPTFLGMINLHAPSILLAIIAAIAQFVQMRMLMTQAPQKPNGEQPDFATLLNQNMLYVGPALTLLFGAQFPAALSLYWAVSTLFSVLQQWWVLHIVVPPTATKS